MDQPGPATAGTRGPPGHPLGDSAAPPASKRSTVGKLAGVVGRNPHASLAVIVVLAILVISLYVYYHGFLRVGPYAAPRRAGPKPPARKDPPADPPESGDPETERLIAAINDK